MTTILVADIGGTNSRFVLYNWVESQLIEKRAESIHSKSVKTFDLILHKFLDVEPSPPKYAVFAIAGVARGSSARVVNMGWDPVDVFAESIQTEFGIEKVVFLNDFEAAGYGCLELKPEDYYKINPDVQAVPTERIFVMGPGTGLGEALLTWNNDKNVSWPGEGGHSDFAPHDDEQ